jgi:hypothetical protein
LLNPVAPPPVTSATNNEIMRLEALKELLAAAIRSLSQGEADNLLQVSREIRSDAETLTSLFSAAPVLPQCDDAKRQHRQLLGELAQQRCFWRALLRRWRRSILLRQRLHDLRSETALYSESLDLTPY